MTASADDREYFAVPDPNDPDRITYWYRNGHAELVAWPPKTRTRYEPVLYKRDVPAELRGDARRAWVRRWFDEHRAPWWAAVHAAIADDPGGCRARFAAFTSRCCCCGKTLTDPASKTYGIGPECRHGLPAAVLVKLADRMGRAHGEWLATQHAEGQAS